MATKPHHQQHVSRAPSASDEELAKSLERELDAALEATFPASDPIAVDSMEVRKVEYESRRKRRIDRG